MTVTAAGMAQYMMPTSNTPHGKLEHEIALCENLITEVEIDIETTELELNDLKEQASEYHDRKEQLYELLEQLEDDD